MQQLIFVAAGSFLIGVISVAIFALFAFRSRERAFRTLTSAYERIIAAADQRVNTAEDRLGDFLDRDYASRNLPPSGVDMLEEHKERKERERVAREERKSGHRVPGKIGQVDAAQDRMAQSMVNEQQAK